MAINYFRMDGWVKSAQGPAVPGAQIYVCTQPANSVSLPPTPLANIFSDVNGLVPITQPIITDGFGHYDFYASAAVYTIVVGLGGVIQQVYPDQSIGGASGSTGGGGGTALVLQVNGTPTVSQLLLNLQSGGSVSIADNGSGTVTITGTVFQTNGVPNTSQSVFNLKSGNNITLSSDSFGGITITGATQGTSFSTAGQGGFFGAGLLLPGPFYLGSSTVTSGILGGNVNQLTVWQFTLLAAMTISEITARCTSGAALATANFGIYDASKSKVLDSGALDFSASTTTRNVTITPVALPSGTYYFAQSSNNTSVTTPSLAPAASTAFIDSMNVNAVRVGQAANLTVAGIMPSTLGVLTPDSVYANMAVPFFQV